MGFLDAIMRRNDGKDSTTIPEVDIRNDQLAAFSQPIDPMTMQMLNAPQGQANAQIAQFAIENDDIVEQIKQELRGYRYEKTYDPIKKIEKLEVIKFGDPIMNDLGINETCRILRMFLSKPFLLSNFPESDRGRIDMMMKILWKKLASKYAILGEKYALDKTRRSDLAFSIVMIVYMNIMRSFEDGERPRMYGSHKTLQNIQQYQNPMGGQEKKGWSIFG